MKKQVSHESALGRIGLAWRECFAVPPTISGSEWAVKYRKLSPEASAQPGDFAINTTPFMRELLDVLCGSDEQVMEIWMMKSSQIAYSENLNNAIGYYMQLDPGPLMMIQPTIEMSESYGKDRIATMLRDSPSLAILTDHRAKNSGNTILRKNFPGGFLQLTGANSPAGLAGRPIRIVICDEVDRFPFSAGEGGKREGDPIALVQRRQTTFFNRLFVAGGTPVRKGLSRTETGYNETDKRVYMVPCPRCKQHIELRWKQFCIDVDSDNYAKYQCQLCDDYIAENERFEMIRDKLAGGSAYWQPTRTEAPKTRRGYFIWTAYSPFMGWKDICDEWLKVKGDPEREQVFTNTVLGQPYSAAVADLDSEKIFAQREDYSSDRMPNDILIITAGIDTQDDRFEAEVVGFGLGEESWSLDYTTIIGDPALKQTRQKLDQFLLEQRYVREDGTELRIKAAFIDSGGHRTDNVYTFCRGKRARHIYPCKGSSITGQPIFARFSHLKKSRTHLAIIGTDTAKEVIYARLSNPTETTGRMHFPAHYGINYFEQLTAEQKIVKWVNGQPRVTFVKVSKRNEALDCRVYALAALRSMPIQLRVMSRRDKRRIAAKNAKAGIKDEQVKPEKTGTNKQKPKKTARKLPIKRKKPKSSWLGVR